MKPSIQTKFTIGIFFFFIIIALLSIVSILFLNKQSRKANAIMNDNHNSVIYSRDMSENLMIIDQEIIANYLSEQQPDTILINKTLKTFASVLQLEKDNITEPGEDAIVNDLTKAFNEYSVLIRNLNQSPHTLNQILIVQKKYNYIFGRLMQLSQINEKAIEMKTNDAVSSARNAVTQMTILGTLCFLITLSFTYSFSTYFSERFYQLLNGIREIVSSNYGHRLYFDNKDEFHEISLVFNEMAEKLNDIQFNGKMNPNTETTDDRSEELLEIRSLLSRLRTMEFQAEELLKKIGNNPS